VKPYRPPDYRRELVIRPKLPSIPWIFDLPPETCIASHPPHEHIEEHLHDHFHHLHIRYGFELPAQSLEGINATALEVVMMIKVEHRVDCNPVFVARGEGPEGVCLKLAGQDVHWVHNEETAAKYTELYQQAGRQVPEGYYFSGFRTADMEERNVWRYDGTTLKAAIGRGIRADQHFQATWKEPRDERIEPYEVVIGLGDEVSSYFTFFKLPIVVPLGAS
jgi:hypothetical protein